LTATADRIPAAGQIPALGGAGSERALGDGSVPGMGGAGWLGHAGAGHRLRDARTAGLASVPVGQLQDRRGGAGASSDCLVRKAGPGSRAVPAAIRQRPGLYKPQLYGAGEGIRLAPVVHHPAHPRAKRPDRTRDPQRQGAVRSSASI